MPLMQSWSFNVNFIGGSLYYPSRLQATDYFEEEKIVSFSYREMGIYVERFTRE